MGAIDEMTTDAAEGAHGCDLIVLCTPVSVLHDLLKQVAPSSKAVITDVGSTKGSVVATAEGLTKQFVGSHPMAGSEKRGVEFARADLFRGARCIVTPTGRTDAGALETVEGFWRAIGMNITRLSAAEHDRLVCDISHLPHMLAAALVAMQSEESLKLAGKGFLDTTRVAGGDGALWRDILVDNRENVIDSVLRLRGKLDEVLAMLSPARGEELKVWLDAAAKRRETLAAEKLRELE